jgi:hypothetical protein
MDAQTHNIPFGEQKRKGFLMGFGGWEAEACTPPRRVLLLRIKGKYTGSKTFPASIKEKETHWPEVPRVSPTKRFFLEAVSSRLTCMIFVAERSNCLI